MGGHKKLLVYYICTANVMIAE